MVPSASGIDWKLLRTLASLRLTADKLDRDSLDGLQSRQVFLFDTNVVRLFCDPYQDRNLLSLFSQRSRTDTSHADPLAANEMRLLFAFALQETSAASEYFSNLSTHVLTPHRRELSQYILNVRDGLISSSRTAFDARKASAFRNNVRHFEQLVQRRAPAHELVRYLELIFQNEMVSTLNVLRRTKTLFSGNFKINTKIAHIEENVEIDVDVWKYFNDMIFAVRQAIAVDDRRSDLTFNIGRDSEAIALICALSAKGYDPIFITADSAIHEVVDSIYLGLDQKVPERIRAALPNKNFVRYPIAYTSFISDYNNNTKTFVAHKYLKDIDFAFLSVSSNEAYDTLLARFAYRPAASNLYYAPKFRDMKVKKWIAESFEKIRERLLFVHEKDAARLAYGFLEEVKTGTFDQVMQNTIAGAFKQWTRRSVADLEDALGKIGALGIGHSMKMKAIGASEPTTIGVILDEWNDGKALGPRTQTRIAALDRRLPGLIRLQPAQLTYFHSLKEVDASKLSEILNQDAMTHPASIFLANALISAVHNDWTISERFAVHSYKRASDTEKDTRREAYYWAALSKRHQVHPGGQRLLDAHQELEEGLGLSEHNEDKLRFKSEMIALALASSYHSYFYSATHEYEPVEIEFDRLYADLAGLELEFRRAVHLPYTAIQSRLATQIYGNLTLLALFGFGLPPGKANNQWYQRNKFLALLRPFEDVISTRRTVSLYTRFLFAASQYLTDTNRKRRDRLIESINEIRLEGEATGAVVAYDLRKMDDFLDLCDPR